VVAALFFCLQKWHAPLPVLGLEQNPQFLFPDIDSSFAPPLDRRLREHLNEIDLPFRPCGPPLSLVVHRGEMSWVGSFPPGSLTFPSRLHCPGKLPPPSSFALFPLPPFFPTFFFIFPSCRQGDASAAFFD